MTLVQVMSETIKLDIDHKNHIGTITLNDPNHLNSLSFEDFIQIGEYLNKLNLDNDLYVTVLQSSGNRMFSSGGKFESIMELKNIDNTNQMNRIRQYIGNVSTPTIHMLNTFSSHNKPIICNLNGPAIGLSACLVLLCDLINVHLPMESEEQGEERKPYLLFPFSSLGFVAEAGSSVMLYNKLSINIANEHLIFSLPIRYNQMKNFGMIWKEYYYRDDYENKIDKNNNLDATDQFNKRCKNDIIKNIIENDLNAEAITEMKRRVIYKMKQRLKKATTEEIINTLPLWLSDEPISRFEQLSNKQRRHKL